MKSLQHHSETEFEHLACQAARLPDAPPSWQRAAVALWAARPAATGLMARVERTRRQILAVLSFDSAATPGLALGMRGSAAAARHLVCSVPGFDIDVRVAAAAGGFDISGQVLGTDGPGEVLLTALDRGDRGDRGDGGDDGFGGAARLDELGEFRLPGLARGRYQLTLRLDGAPGDDIVMPTIVVGAA